jgi:hypothetical protein
MIVLGLVIKPPSTFPESKASAVLNDGIKKLILRHAPYSLHFGGTEFESLVLRSGIQLKLVLLYMEPIYFILTI